MGRSEREKKDRHYSVEFVYEFGSPSVLCSEKNKKMPAFPFPGTGRKTSPLVRVGRLVYQGVEPLARS